MTRGLSSQPACTQAGVTDQHVGYNFTVLMVVLTITNTWGAMFYRTKSHSTDASNILKTDS